MAAAPEPSAPQSMSRYRSMRRPAHHAEPAPPAPPPASSSMAAAAASASLQRSQSRYHRPGAPKGPPPAMPKITPPQESRALRKSTSFPSPTSPAMGHIDSALRPRVPVVAAAAAATADDARAAEFHDQLRQADLVQTPTPPRRTPHVPEPAAAQLSESPPDDSSLEAASPLGVDDVEKTGLPASPSELARLESQRLVDLEARRQLDLRDRLRAQKDHEERLKAGRLQQERIQRAHDLAEQKERLHGEEVRREALRIRSERDAKETQLREQREQQEREETEQDRRIKALARARYEEKQLEWLQQEREQKAQHERHLQDRRDKREAHRRQIQARSSDSNLRGDGGAMVKRTGTFRRRESDRVAPPYFDTTPTEALARVFSQRRKPPPPPQPKVTLGTSYDEVAAGQAPTPVERIIKDEMPVFVRRTEPAVAAAGPDAPVSAVNAGQRRVKVQCGASSIRLPVTPTTTPKDLLYSAANCLSEPIDSSKSVVMEQFGKVGIERPLRHYEHVRDVMNSWDDDKQNILWIVPSGTGGKDEELDAKYVPSEEPGDSSFQMYYSQKPGKWEKRYITLRTDGQIVYSKKANSKDYTKICHMSDYDIYTPMASALSDRINPPKRVCFGIKSQQKSAMFESTENFVHFFSTNHQFDAASFYRAVQGWRSWYLVNIMGEGQKSRLQPTNAGAVDTDVALSTPDHRDTHYQIGSFKPLLDFDEMFGKDRPRSTAGPPSPGVRPESRRFSKRISVGPPSPRLGGPPSPRFGGPPSPRLGGPPSPRLPGPSSPRLSSFGPTSPTFNHNPPHSRQGINSRSDGSSEDTFSPDGLLGRTYSSKQAELFARANAPDDSGPFTSGPSLMSEIDAALGRTTSSANRHSTRYTGGKALNDVPTSRGGLIDGATTKDDAFVIKRKSVRQSLPAVNRRTSTQPTDESPFFADGLLANAGYSQGGQRTGRGVMAGTDAKGPMLDMRDGGQFAQGSLLEKAERDKLGFGHHGPVIDRSKAREVKVGTGEGL